MRRAIIIGLMAIGLGGCAVAERPMAAAPAAPCADVLSVASPPGRQWWQAQRWRYASDEAATAAYRRLIDAAPAWPDWFVPREEMVATGTRVQMALAPGQPETQPGAFGTFDFIGGSRDVRDYLAVRRAWKPAVDRVVTYEVTQLLPARIGPIGPQVDPDLCALLPGRWSQMEMLLPREKRMEYLRVIEVRPID